MSKKEMREWMAKDSKAFGDAAFEKREIERLQGENNGSDVSTITVGCGTFLSVACC